MSPEPAIPHNERDKDQEACDVTLFLNFPIDLNPEERAHVVTHFGDPPDEVELARFVRMRQLLQVFYIVLLFVLAPGRQTCT